ncbi:hypothetical protein RintRC_4890 [Richelia intracellularis]|nr:hypothetical protein RintRC_4890 [Richelia intracellularis]
MTTQGSPAAVITSGAALAAMTLRLYSVSPVGAIAPGSNQVPGP